MNRVAFANRIKKNVEFLNENSKSFLENSKKHRYSLGIWGRQAGKTTVISVAARDFMRDHEGAICLVVSNKLVLGQNLINSVHLLFEDSEVKKRAKSYVQLRNGSIAICCTPSSFERLEKEFRPNLVLVDDFEYIDAEKIGKIIHLRDKEKKSNWFKKFICSLMGKCQLSTKYIFFGGRDDSENYLILRKNLPEKETYVSVNSKKIVPCSPEMAQQCPVLLDS